MLQGTLTAMITPFRNGEVDFERLKANTRWQIEQGINGLVPTGTTGESPTLSHAEHRQVVETVIETAGGEVPVMAGTGSNATSEAVELTRHAKEAGADYALSVNPYYNKPTQEGLYRHFCTVADVGLPVVLYNIPGRSAVELEPDTIVRLASHGNIVAIKEATGRMDVTSEVAWRTDLAILSGDDSLTLPLISIGARGVISVLSNLMPADLVAMTKAALAGDFDAARNIHLRLFRLFKAIFIETNPIPIKTAMARKEMDTGELRLPLCEMMPDSWLKFEDVLREAGVV